MRQLLIALIIAVGMCGISYAQSAGGVRRITLFDTDRSTHGQLYIDGSGRGAFKLFTDTYPTTSSALTSQTLWLQGVNIIDNQKKINNIRAATFNTVGAEAALLVQRDGTSLANIGTGGAYFGITGMNSKPLAFVAGTANMTLSNNGGLAIGTGSGIGPLTGRIFEAYQSTAATEGIVLFRGGEGANASLQLFADDGDNNTDGWRWSVADGGNISLDYFGSGAFVSYFNLYGSGATVPSAAVFNENSANTSLRVESDGNANMLFVDGVNNRVGIGTGSPTVQLDVSGGSAYVSSEIVAGGDIVARGGDVTIGSEVSGQSKVMDIFRYGTATTAGSTVFILEDYAYTVAVIEVTLSAHKGSTPDWVGKKEISVWRNEGSTWSQSAGGTETIIDHVTGSDDIEISYVDSSGLHIAVQTDTASMGYAMSIRITLIRDVS